LLRNGSQVASSTQSFWTIDAGGGSDSIEIDISVPSSATTTLLGGSGNDTIRGQLSTDSIVGGDGDDSIFASDKHDTVFGGAGNDIYDASNIPSSTTLNWSLDGTANDRFFSLGVLVFT